LILFLLPLNAVYVTIVIIANPLVFIIKEINIVKSDAQKCVWCSKENVVVILRSFINTQDDAWNIGMRRVEKIIEEEKLKGFKVFGTGMYSKDVDILVFSGNTVKKVYEVTNYASPTEYVRSDRAERYKGNLLSWDDVERIFVCSYEENLRYLNGRRKYFEDSGITVQVVGHQD
jgi:hypothetical protein